MKNYIKYLAIFALIVLVSATTSGIMTMKPANPVMVLVKTFNYVEHTDEYIKNGYKRGYILKGIYNNGNTKDVLVVMEKY